METIVTCDAKQNGKEEMTGYYWLYFESWFHFFKRVWLCQLADELSRITKSLQNISLSSNRCLYIACPASKCPLQDLKVHYIGKIYFTVNTLALL